MTTVYTTAEGPPRGSLGFLQLGLVNGQSSLEPLLRALLKSLLLEDLISVSFEVHQGGFPLLF